MSRAGEKKLRLFVRDLQNCIAAGDASGLKKVSYLCVQLVCS